MADRTVMTLPVAIIAVPDDRIGYFDADHAARLGADMAANGQHDPIHVKRDGNAGKLPWTLVAGKHRLRGAIGAGLATVDAIQVAGPGATVDELRRLELSENVDHRRPRPIERAIFMAARARIEEALDHPDHVGESRQERGARLRHSATATMAVAECQSPASITVMNAGDWRQRTADAMGCSVRTLERLERIHRDIVVALPDHAEALNFHPLGESLSAMSKLATQNPTARRTVAEIILSKPDWRSMDEVMKQIDPSASTGARYHHTERARAAWTLMNLSERRHHVAWLAENVTPGMAQDMVAAFKASGKLP